MCLCDSRKCAIKDFHHLAWSHILGPLLPHSRALEPGEEEGVIAVRGVELLLSLQEARRTQRIMGNCHT